jgi:putative ABC transport system permease protein
MPIGEPWNDTLLRRRTYDAVLTNLRAASGVAAAGLIQRLPLEPVRGGVEVSAVGAATEKMLTHLQETSEHYLDAVGARLIEGRDFATSDRADQPTVALINDVLARHLFPGESAVGKSVRYEFMRGPVQAQVIGVVHAVQYGGLTGETKPEIYTTYRQSLAVPMSLVVRSTGGAMTLVPAIRSAVADADPSRALTLDGISTLDDQLGRQFARPRFFLTLVGTFATIALLLSSLGLYGMLSFWTAQHRRELGVRLALGATREHVAALVVKRGLAVVGAGLAVGLGLTLATGKYLESLLFGVPPADLPTLLTAASVLVAIAVLVCAVPGRQAARVNPIEIRRAE